MPIFHYTARDRSGNVTSGYVEADSDSSAVARLQDSGLWVTDLRSPTGRPATQQGQSAPAAPSLASGTGKKLFSPVPLKDLSLFYRQLYTLLNSGIGMYQAFEMLGNPTQTPNAQLRRAAVAIGQQVLAGGRVSEAMARYPWLFEKMQRRMVEAGEYGGLLVEIFHRLADYLEREHAIRQEIKKKTLYPKLLLLALLLIPPIPTLVLLGIVPYLVEVARTVEGIALVCIPLYLMVRALLTTQAGREGYDRLKLVLPVIGPLVRKLAVARFARTLAALYGAGVPIMTSVSLAGETCGNHVLESATLRCVPAIERGVSITQALTASGFFPPMFLGMVSTGETSGNLDQMLDKAAAFYEEEAQHATVQLTVILGVVLLLIVAILVAIKIISFWTGFYGGVSSGGAPGSLPGGSPNGVHAPAPGGGDAGE